MAGRKLPLRLSEKQKFILTSISLHTPTLYDRLHSKYESHYTESSAEAFSRSLKKLEERKLLLRYPRSSEIGGTQATLPSQMLHSQHNTTWIVPTPKGDNVGNELIRRAKDGRFSLSFPLFE